MPRDHDQAASSSHLICFPSPARDWVTPPSLYSITSLVLRLDVSSLKRKTGEERQECQMREGLLLSVSFRSPVTKTSNHEAVATVSTRNSPPFHTPVLNGFCESRDQNLASNAALVTKPQSWQFCFFDRKMGIEHTSLSILEFSECLKPEVM